MGSSTGTTALMQRNGLSSSRSVPATSSFARLFLLGLLHIGITCARPLGHPRQLMTLYDVDDSGEEDAATWIYLTTAIALVLLGGVFAGLTIA